MATRRGFVRGASAAFAAFALMPRGFGKTTDRPLGVQLYTVRSQVEKDLPGTLAAIRKIGYRTVETYGGQYKIAAKDLRQAIIDAGLTAPSAHFGYDDLGAHFNYARELGVECMVCSMIPASMSNSADGFKRAADQYNAWGEQARKAGLEFAFHNHNMEFKDLGGVLGIDLLLENTDPAVVGWEMDCYWVAQAGCDPVEMLNKHGKRMQSLHLKDRKPDAPTSTNLGPGSAHFTEVGAGTLDWPDILRLSQQFNIRNMYVEQDQTELPPLESLEISYTNLMRFLKE